MTFFERQKAARRKTSVLLLLMLLAVVAILLAVNLLCAVSFSLSDETGVTIASWFSSSAAAMVSGITLLVIVLGTLFTSLRLRGGGKVVALMAGGRLVDADTQDPKLQRLINVLDEMSIASGTPRPALYLMDQEQGINAFVAGTRSTDAVMAVTQGTLDNLNREQLQGVVAHEYSHILNGDMRLNIRLMGLLAGILLIGQAGRSMMHSRSLGRSLDRNSRGGAMMFGLGLFAIGYIGIFFAGLIKAAVSRQREFLADAASVQFTRNPDGIAGALWKIKQHSVGATLLSEHKDDISHLCFGEPIKQRFQSLMATHPPILARIKSVHPSFVPRADDDDPVRQAPVTSPESDSAGTSAAHGFVSFAAAAAAGTLTPATMTARVGTVGPDDMDAASHMLKSLPQALLAAAHGSEAAKAVIYVLFCPPKNDPHHAAGMQALNVSESTVVNEHVAALLGNADQLDRRLRLPLLNLCIASLQQLRPEEQKKLLAISLVLIRADKKYSLSEFALHTILCGHLGASARQDVPVSYQHYHQLIAEISILMAMMARAGSENNEAQRLAYEHAMRRYSKAGKPPVWPENCDYDSVQKALNKINRLPPMRKESVLASCAESVIHDGLVTADEAELMQAVALSLDCPMPPIPSVAEPADAL
ncbi:MAG: M48 family metallopeptidase [Oceanococcus sp.]